MAVKMQQQFTRCVAVAPERSGIVIGEPVGDNIVHVPFTGYGAAWSDDMFGTNVARAKLRLRDAVAVWHYQANTWACGRQDHYGEQLDELVKFCRVNYYDILDEILAEEEGS